MDKEKKNKANQLQKKGELSLSFQSCDWFVCLNLSGCSIQNGKGE